MINSDSEYLQAALDEDRVRMRDEAMRQVEDKIVRPELCSKIAVERRL